MDGRSGATSSTVGDANCKGYPLADCLDALTVSEAYCHQVGINPSGSSMEDLQRSIFLSGRGENPYIQMMPWYDYHLPVEQLQFPVMSAAENFLNPYHSVMMSTPPSDALSQQQQSQLPNSVPWRLADTSQSQNTMHQPTFPTPQGFRQANQGQSSYRHPSSDFSLPPRVPLFRPPFQPNVPYNTGNQFIGNPPIVMTPTPTGHWIVQPTDQMAYHQMNMWGNDQNVPWQDQRVAVARYTLPEECNFPMRGQFSMDTWSWNQPPPDSNRRRKSKQHKFRQSNTPSQGNQDNGKLPNQTSTVVVENIKSVNTKAGLTADARNAIPRRLRPGTPLPYTPQKEEEAAKSTDNKSEVEPDSTNAPIASVMTDLTPVKFCRLCKSNQETPSFYFSHVLQDEDGIVRCPVLRDLVCFSCGATGDNAHTAKYCPFHVNGPKVGYCAPKKSSEHELKDENEDKGNDREGGAKRVNEGETSYQTTRTAAGGYSLSKF